MRLRLAVLVLLCATPFAWPAPLASQPPVEASVEAAVVVDRAVVDASIDGAVEAMDDTGLAYTFGGEVFGGASLVGQETVEGGNFTGGLNLAFGLPLGGWIEPRVRIDATHHSAGSNEDALVSIAGLAGVRLRMNEVAPLFVDAHAGYAFALNAPARDIASGAILDFGAGVRYALCDDGNHRLSSSAWTFGVRTRLGIDGNAGMTALYGLIGYEYGGGSPAFARECGTDDEPEVREPDASASAGGAWVVGEPEDHAPAAEIEVIAHDSLPDPHAASVAARAATSAAAEPEEESSLRLPLRIGVELMVGWLEAGAANDHLGLGIALPVDVRLTRHFGIGARLSAQSLGDPATDVDGDGRDDVDEGNYDTLAVWGGPRLTLWTDEADRQGWSFALDAGYIWGEGNDEGPGFEVVIGRQAGGFFANSAAFDVGLSLRYQQGLGDMADYRALLFGADIAMELGIVEPVSDPEESSLRYLFGADLLAGWAVSGRGAVEGGEQMAAVGLHFGIPITAGLIPMVRAEIGVRDSGDESDGIPLLAGFGGLRVRLDEYFPVQFDLGAGYVAAYGTFGDQITDGGVLDVGIGTNLFCMGSDSSFGVGVRGRVGLTDNREMDAVLFTVSGTYAGGEDLLGRDTFWCRNEDANAEHRAQVEAEWDRHRAPDVEVVEVVEVRGPDMHLETQPVEVVPQVEVDVRLPLAPIVVEVPLSLSFLGGAIQIDLDADALPIAELRAAATVEVRLEGPEQAIVRADAMLKAAVGRSGVHIDRVVHVVTSGPSARAVFIIQPR
jgi:hypothetical protein